MCSAFPGAHSLTQKPSFPHYPQNKTSHPPLSSSHTHNSLCHLHFLSYSNLALLAFDSSDLLNITCCLLHSAHQSICISAPVELMHCGAVPVWLRKLCLQLHQLCLTVTCSGLQALLCWAQVGVNSSREGLGYGLS